MYGLSLHNVTLVWHETSTKEHSMRDHVLQNHRVKEHVDMRRYSIIFVELCCLLSVYTWSAAQETAAPPSLDMESSKAIWQRVAESQDDLNVFEKVKFLGDVPIVASDAGGSPPAAAMASIVCRLDGEGKRRGSVSGICSGELALMVRETVVGAETDKSKKMQLINRIKPVWTALCEQYNRDIWKAALPYHGQVTKGECYAMALQAHYDKVEGATPLHRMAKAITSFLKDRDILISTAVEEASWDKCCESLTRGFPFVCSLGPSEKPTLYVAIGYVEDKGKKYLLALDPSKVKTTTKRPAKPEADTNQARNDEELDTAISPLGVVMVYRPDETVTMRDPSTSGAVMLPITSDRLSCLFVHNIRRDKEAVQKRIRQVPLQVQEKDSRKKQ